jgi:hypothetical protein
MPGRGRVRHRGMTLVSGASCVGRAGGFFGSRNHAGWGMFAIPFAMPVKTFIKVSDSGKPICQDRRTPCAARWQILAIDKFNTGLAVLGKCRSLKDPTGRFWSAVGMVLFLKAARRAFLQIGH